MISQKLRHLSQIAERMESLLPSSTRTYRAMYATLEHDVDMALEGIAQRMIEKYNIPTQDLDNTPDFVPDADLSMPNLKEGTHDPSS